ncbi:hypothetical protein [Streptomyces sp. GESEQ-35]|uniref:hypothetical protein n=1 Tax=Streptomyces sp. GESEQ-35 TaxID=2812657 RepID=UPI001B330F01|nr:hypothetical protein [Streptomyces sp. GESEQ-35]
MRVARVEVQDQGIEEQQRALLEQRAAELAGTGRRDLDHGVGELCKSAQPSLHSPPPGR